MTVNKIRQFTNSPSLHKGQKVNQRRLAHEGLMFSQPPFDNHLLKPVTIHQNLLEFLSHVFCNEFPFFFRERII